jgi:RNA polymerase sigma factor (sigma-70 family)
MDDAGVVRHAQKGIGHAFAELVERYTPVLYALCRARVRRRDEVPDLVQEALLRAWQQLHTLTAPQRFGPWLCGIARHLCYSRRQDVQHTRETLFTDLDNQAEVLAVEMPATVAIPATDRFGELMAEWRRLPAHCREALLLRLMKAPECWVL